MYVFHWHLKPISTSHLAHVCFRTLSIEPHWCVQIRTKFVNLFQGWCMQIVLATTYNTYYAQNDLIKLNINTVSKHANMLKFDKSLITNCCFYEFVCLHRYRAMSCICKQLCTHTTWLDYIYTVHTLFICMFTVMALQCNQ